MSTTVPICNTSDNAAHSFDIDPNYRLHHVIAFTIYSTASTAIIIASKLPSITVIRTIGLYIIGHLIYERISINNRIHEIQKVSIISLFIQTCELTIAQKFPQKWLPFIALYHISGSMYKHGSALVSHINRQTGNDYQSNLPQNISGAAIAHFTLFAYSIISASNMIISRASPKMFLLGASTRFITHLFQLKQKWSSAAMIDAIATCLIWFKYTKQQSITGACLYMLGAISISAFCVSKIRNAPVFISPNGVESRSPYISL